MDTVGYGELLEYLRSITPNFDTEFAPHTPTILDYYDTRKAVRKGGNLIELNSKFQEKHQSEVIEKIKPVIPALIQFVGKLD